MERVLLVLGGGGMKGMAHVGAWRAIEESGLRVEGIIGTSIGAFIGACLAGGEGWRELAPRALALEKRDIVVLNRWAMLLNGIRQPSVFVGERFRQYIASVLPATGFGDLAIPLEVNAVDLSTGETVWFGPGEESGVPLADAVYASCALPVFYPPAEIDGRWYVDGGLAGSLPLARAAGRDVDAVVAVDVSSDAAVDAAEVVAQGIVGMHHRTMQIMGAARRRTQIEAWPGTPRLVHVRPRLDEAGTWEFSRTAYFLEEGYRATRRELAAAAGSSAPPGTGRS